jgi:predicted extracellular nuclease
MKNFLLLITSCSSLLLGAQNDCSDLFISEYVEGSHNNKALEIYNPTDTDINLNGTYDLVRYSNGAGESIESDIQYVQPLTGTVPAYGTFIALLLLKML